MQIRLGVWQSRCHYRPAKISELPQGPNSFHFLDLKRSASKILITLATTALRASAARSGYEATLPILCIDNSSHCPNGLIDVSWTPPPLPAITYNFIHLLLTSSSPKQAHNFKHLLLPSSSPSKPYYQNFVLFLSNPRNTSLTV